MISVLTKNVRTERVKSCKQCSVDLIADELLYASAHLRSGLVREREAKNTEAFPHRFR
jgi:hypothetical protein